MSGAREITTDRQTLPRRLIVTVSVAIIAVGVLRAWALRWTCDDAFISFRYADNLARGLGLVWNHGERVEGITNLLWTLMLAPAAAAGIDLVPVAQALGIGSLVLLALVLLRWSTRGPGAPPRLPLALWMTLLAPDVLVWTTGGLETMSFTAIAAAMALLLHGQPGTRPAAAEWGAGVAGALLILLRPDGVLIAGVLAAWYLGAAVARRDRRAALSCCLRVGGPMLVTLIGATVFRLAYFGDPLPNTFYAKSASSAYWQPGLIYAGLLLARQYGLAVAVLLAAALSGWALAARGRSGTEPEWARRGRMQGAAKRRILEVFKRAATPQTAPPRPFRRRGDFVHGLLTVRMTPAGNNPHAAARPETGTGIRESSSGAAATAVAALVFALYVIRSGGDFMYARRLIPAVPLALMAVERVLSIAATPRARSCIVVAFSLMSALPIPVFQTWGRSGRIGFVADEPAFYPGPVVALRRAQGQALARTFDGIDANFIMEGGLCMLAYYSRLPHIVDVNGLTDRHIARSDVGARGRPGHEKAAPQAYLHERRVHFLIRNAPPPAPPVPRTVAVAGGLVPLQWMIYDDDVMQPLQARPGVVFAPVSEHLDRERAAMAGDRCDAAQARLERLQRYYFKWNPGQQATERSLAAMVAGRCAAADASMASTAR